MKRPKNILAQKDLRLGHELPARTLGESYAAPRGVAHGEVLFSSPQGEGDEWVLPKGGLIPGNEYVVDTRVPANTPRVYVAHKSYNAPVLSQTRFRTAEAASRSTSSYVALQSYIDSTCIKGTQETRPVLCKAPNLPHLLCPQVALVSP